MKKRSIAFCTFALVIAGISSYAYAEDESLVQAGMTQSDVTKTLGQPDRVSTNAADNDTRWEYQQAGEDTLAIDFGPDGTVHSITSNSFDQE